MQEIDGLLLLYCPAPYPFKVVIKGHCSGEQDILSAKLVFLEDFLVAELVQDV